jgi:hypothetical protein
MLRRTAFVVLTIALCVTLAPGTDFRRIDKLGVSLGDRPAATGARSPSDGNIESNQVNSYAGATAPVIDGYLDVDEWADAFSFDCSNFLGWGGVSYGPGVAYAYFMNDISFLYVAVTMPEAMTRDIGDKVGLCIDENNDGVWSSTLNEGEYQIWVNGSGADQVQFRYHSPSVIGQWGSVVGSNSVSATSNGYLVFEARIPIGTQPYRLQLDNPSSDTVGLYLYSLDDSRYYGWFPGDLDSDDWNDPSQYGKLIFTAERPGDAACMSIDAPVGTVCGRGTYEPKATVQNLSDSPRSFEVMFSIADGSGYMSTRTTPLLVPGEVFQLTFDSWHPSGQGTYTAECETGLSGDIDPSNDLRTGAVKVLLWPLGWVEMEQVPMGPRKRGIKDGAWLAHLPTDRYVYAIKGDMTEEFYRYDIDGNSWHPRAPIPKGREGKLPYFGARGVQADSLHIYATKGNNTFGFWRYNIPPDSWVQLADIPARPNGDTKVAGGTDLTYVPESDSTGARTGGYVYLLKGHSGEFYRYNVNSGEWEERQHAPPYVGNTLWKTGSFITYDGDHTIYADRSFDRPKGQYGNEVWTFDLSSQSWSQTALAGMPGLPSQQSQDGGCGDWSDGSVFALKGGDTDEFWQYTPSDQWRALDPMPQMGSSGKARKVFWGGDIVGHGCGAFFALKGHDTPEFWRYVLGPEQPKGGAASGGSVTATLVTLAVSPNPLTNGAATVAYRVAAPGPARVTLFDALGRVVMRERFVATCVGRLELDTRSLNAGFYLARLESGGLTASQKIVVDH